MVLCIAATNTRLPPEQPQHPVIKLGHLFDTVGLALVFATGIKAVHDVVITDATKFDSTFATLAFN